MATGSELTGLEERGSPTSDMLPIFGTSAPHRREQARLQHRQFRSSGFSSLNVVNLRGLSGETWGGEKARREE